MNTLKKSSTLLTPRTYVTPLTVAAATALLAACGSDSSNNNGNAAGGGHDEHDHSAVALISTQQSPSLYFFDEDEGGFEALGTSMSANAGTFVAAEDGMSVAIINGAQVNFAGIHQDEEHEEGENDEAENEEAHDHTIPEVFELSAAGSQVVATHGHFSVLSNANISLLIPTNALEASDGFEETVDTPSQFAPAIILSEETESVLVFANATATVYSEGVTTDSSVTCNQFNISFAAEEQQVVSCDNNLSVLSLNGEAWTFSDIETPPVTLNALQWVHLHEQAYAYQVGTQDLYVLHLHDENALEMINTNDALDGTICQIALETEEQDVLFALTSNAGIIGLKPTASKENDFVKSFRVALDESTPSLNCADVMVAGGPETALVADNNIGVVYLIDAHEGPYHIHQRIAMPAGQTVADMVLLQELDASDEHSHDE